MAKSYGKAKGRRDGGTYIGIPHSVMDSADFRSLSGSAMIALMALVRQFNGHNNGDYSLTHSMAKEWRIGSKTTLANALGELMKKNLIVRTRDPTRDKQNPHGQCALYGVTWKPIDYCKGKLDIEPTNTPLRAFSLGAKCTG